MRTGFRLAIRTTFQLHVCPCQIIWRHEYNHKTYKGQLNFTWWNSTTLTKDHYGGSVLLWVHNVQEKSCYHEYSL
jgi:hypothetical protein